MSNEEKILEMLTEMRADISELKTVQAQQGETLAEHGKMLTELKAVQDEQGKTLEKVSERLDKVDERLDKVNKRMDKVNERLDKVDERLDKVDERLDKVDERLKEIDARSRKSAVLLEGEIGPKVQLLFEAVSTHAQTLEKKERVDRIEETLDQKAVVLESITKSHTERIEKLEKAI